ncbi:hypothetical protein IV203_037616 [Nitzschia inconspicua]|uniref:Uncharacterized protein n=1 Tax=Nitzschia inconspicua TaxID=303405 RepID=A0A9K3LL38_9STRA|nr:hypothetical protein IV203_037616 [Nitzschia inconspicua]
MFRQHRNFNQRNQANQRRKSAVPQGPRVVIPLKPDFSLSESRTVKFSISLPVAGQEGAYEKTVVEVPKLTDDATPMQAFHFTREFFSACETMSWTTGAKRFEKVKQVLEGKHKDVLLTYMNAEASRSVDSFQDAMDTILAEFFEETVDYEDQMLYLRTGLKKPSTMSPKEFATLLEMANEYVKLIPGAPDDSAGLTPNEMCRVYLHAMPKHWQTNFTNAGKNVISEKPSNLCAFTLKLSQFKILTPQEDNLVMVTVKRREATATAMDATATVITITPTVTKDVITTIVETTPTTTVKTKEALMPTHHALCLTIVDIQSVNVALSVMPSEQTVVGTTITTTIATATETTDTITVPVITNPT